jgi:hypothetical protein
MFPAFFGDWFAEKKGRLEHIQTVFQKILMIRGIFVLSSLEL